MVGAIQNTNLHIKLVFIINLILPYIISHNITVAYLMNIFILNFFYLFIKGFTSLFAVAEISDVTNNNN